MKKTPANLSHLMPWVIVRQVGSKVSNKRIKRLCPEQLHSVLPLISADERGVADDLECCRFKRLVQLAKPLLLAVLKKAVELVTGSRCVGDLVDVMVEGLGVLDRRRESIVLIMKFGEEVGPLQAKLPVWPAPAWVAYIVHPLGTRVLGGW